MMTEEAIDDMSEEGIQLQHNDLTYLSSALQALREVGSLCDVVIRCEGDDGDDTSGSLFAHACVLAACSPYLREQIVVQRQAGDEFTEISGQGMSGQVWEYIIHFMYTASVFVPTQHMKDVVAAAELLQFPELYDIAAQSQCMIEAMEKENRNNAEDIVKAEPADAGHLKEAEFEIANDYPEVSVLVEDSLQCAICSYKARTQKALAAHGRKHITEVTSSKQCDQCSKEFSTARALKKHAKIHVKEESYQGQDRDIAHSPNETLKDEADTNKEDEEDPCPVADCDFKTCKPGMMRKHLKQEHSDLTKPYQCPKCDYSAVRKVQLKLHCEKHSEERLYKCTDCDKAFKRHRDLWRHRQQQHDDGEKHKCDMCDKLFNRKVYLQDHMRRDHQVGQLKCTVPGCEISFETYDKLYRHKRIIHDNRAFERSRKHVCGICGRRFFTKSHLITHEHAHKNERPFPCEICSKAFLQRSDLTKHMMIHSGVKPFLCSLCPYTTNRASNLKSHEKRHAGQKLLRHGQCDKCEFQYTTLKELRQHQVKVHAAGSPTGGKKRKLDSAFTNIIVKYEDSEDKDEPVMTSNPQTPMPAATRRKVAEKSNIVTLHPLSKDMHAVERRVPKSAIIAELPAGESLADGYQMFTPVEHSQEQAPKYTQIVTKSLANSGRIQTVLQTTTANLPPSLCIIANSESGSQQIQPMDRDNELPIEVIHDINLGNEDAQVVQVSTSSSQYSPAVYTIMNTEEDELNPEPTAITSGDYNISKDD